MLLRASHDGYADRFSVVHQRALDAVDRRPAARRRGPVHAGATARRCPPDRDEFAVRFHLHPSVKANRADRRPRRHADAAEPEVWTFNAYEDRVELEESVYLAGPDGPRRTVQIVIYGRARKVPRVHWTFAAHPRRPGAGRRAARATTSRELPL